MKASLNGLPFLNVAEAKPSTQREEILFEVDPSRALRVSIDQAKLPPELKSILPQVKALLEKYPSQKELEGAIQAANAPVEAENQGRALAAMVLGMASSGIGVVLPVMSSFLSDDGFAKKLAALLVGTGYTALIATASTVGLPIAIAAGAALGTAVVLMPQDGIDRVDAFRRAAIQNYVP
jgi:hypothetical protein